MYNAVAGAAYIRTNSSDCTGEASTGTEPLGCNGLNINNGVKRIYLGVSCQGGPTSIPTTPDPTTAPTPDPTASPTPDPTTAPTTAPTPNPTAAPASEPTDAPSTAPSLKPSPAQSAKPSLVPTAPANIPTLAPTASPTAGIFILIFAAFII